MPWVFVRFPSRTALAAGDFFDVLNAQPANAKSRSPKTSLRFSRNDAWVPAGANCG